MKALSRAEIDLLSPGERLELIGDLWDSLNDAQAGVPPAQREELERRLAGFGEDQHGAMTWDQLKAELARRA